MPLPDSDDLVTLDYVYQGGPYVEAAASAAVELDTLDVVYQGGPFVAGPTTPSTAEGRITQVVVERLSQTPTNAYITQFLVEALRVNPPEAKPGTSWNRFDRVNTFDVTLIRGTLSSAVDDLAVLNGANAALIGDEIIQFRDVASLGGTSYRLSYLLRGRLGTEWAMNSHTVGERFVMLSSGMVKKLHESLDDISTTRLYRCVNSGQTLGAALPHAEFHDGIALKPYAPCHVTGERDGSDNLTISWFRRTRINGAWRDVVNVPLGEATEEYEVDIVDGAGTVVRTLTSTSESVVYSAANQTTDFGGPQALVTVRVYQLSEAVGRGYGAQVNV